MSRKKTIEFIEESSQPHALIINGGVVSSLLIKTLKDQGCEVTTYDSYSPTPNKIDYIFLFDNQSLADEIYEKHLSRNGKFILIETTEGIPPRIFSHPRIKILRVGDLSLWSLPQLAEKILRTLFSIVGMTVSSPVGTRRIVATMK